MTDSTGDAPYGEFGRPTSSWWAYVIKVAGNDSMATIKKRTGIAQTTLPRWQRGTRGIDAHDVVAFARAYERPPLEALVIAGFLTPDEAAAFDKPAPR